MVYLIREQGFMTNIDKRFKALAFVWLLFCFFAAQHYIEHAGMEGMFMRIFMYGIFASPVWLGYGWIYLNDTKEIPLKLYIIPALGYFIFGLYLNDEYREGKLTLLAWACGFFYLILVFPYTSAAILLFKLKWQTILRGSSLRREETPLEDVLVLDFLWAKNMRASKGKPRDGIVGSKVVEVMLRVKERWSNMLPNIEPNKRMTNPTIGIKREDIFPLMQIFEEEFGTLGPSLVSSSRKQRPFISTSDQRSFSISPLRQPVRAIRIMALSASRFQPF